MGRVGEVVGYDADDDSKGGDVKVDPGGEDTVAARHYAPPGDDSPPLDGDWAALEDSAGSGVEAALGYEDDTTKVAQRGEKRIYGRDAGGTPVAEVHLQRDGTVVIRSLTDPSGVVRLAGAADFVALAAKVDDFIGKLDMLIRTTWIPVPNDGGALLKTKYAETFPESPESVAAEKVRAE